jgi:hypothetical protein
LENLARLRRASEATGEAVIAMDTTKTALLGHFPRAGTTCTAETVETVAHAGGSAGQGQLIPHGIYAMRNQHAHLHLNTRHDTSARCGDSVAVWWEHAGRAASPQAKRLLVLGDGGGSKSATQSLCKADLQALTNRVGLAMRMAHSPPYGSTHNPIAHRVCPPLTRACQGGIFHTVDLARPCIERAHTATGLRVTVRLLDAGYQTGRTYAADFKHHRHIVFDEYLPKWNYRAVPEGT